MLANDFLHAVKALRLYFRSEVRYVADFYRREKSITSAGFESANIGSNGKARYITKATSMWYT
jgi:hypothetical protein